jgi:hypothetical protein
VRLFQIPDQMELLVGTGNLSNRRKANMPSPETINRLETELLAARTEAEGFLLAVSPGELDLPAWLADRVRTVSALFHSPLVRLLSLAGKSPMLGSVDVKALQVALRTIDAALRLREYYEWETEVLHDEGRVLGVRSAGSSEDRRISPEAAREEIRNAIDQVSRRIAILRAQAEAEESGQTTSVEQALGAAAVSIRPGTAFIIMAIDPGKPELEDVKRTIQQECARFNIRAIRADDIEHSGEITHRILETIRTSEFLIADLTDERPSVYYEVGFAHAIGKRPILYRKAGTRLHFDLAVHNCPEYANLTDLTNKLNRRLTAMTRGE